MYRKTFYHSYTTAKLLIQNKEVRMEFHKNFYLCINCAVKGYKKGKQKNQYTLLFLLIIWISIIVSYFLIMDADFEDFKLQAGLVLGLLSVFIGVSGFCICFLTEFFSDSFNPLDLYINSFFGKNIKEISGYTLKNEIARKNVIKELKKERENYERIEMAIFKKENPIPTKAAGGIKYCEKCRYRLSYKEKLEGKSICKNCTKDKDN